MARYDVVTTLAAGDQRVTSTRRFSTTVGGVSPASGGRVTVRAVAPMRRGAIRSARFRATSQRAPTRFGPLPRLPRR